MPQITTKVLSFAVLGALALALSGCGDANPQASFDPAAGKHPANWLPAGHSVAAEEDINGCVECHGDNLKGGIAKVSCMKDPVSGTGCHAGSATSVHPVLWGGLAYALHAGYVETNGNASCKVAECHGPALTGVTGSGPACTTCHMDGTAEAPQIHQWGGVGASTAANIAGHVNYFETAPRISFTTCRNAVCHGTTLAGAFASGPSCIKNGCHGSGNPLPAEN
ncbi:hypothetical protein [Geomonas subterranea]|uniref:Uncharacterized protein n=1 Tax=Geomonas subterranea TaxID=2847989 RepID=A0ABX8LFJ6_9BACT|nr:MULTISPECIES: hypothetical protein [Geomonas]QXE89154.1 hypothetical protein KP001_11820 [Geomonas subterranea]QXM08729.1 hypothetical protein KP002_17455 [Geomonas subterranea]